MRPETPVPLAEVGWHPIHQDAALPDAAGGKARGLHAIIRTGLPAPPSWVVLPTTADHAVAGLADELRARGHLLLAVRSSAPDEDAGCHSFAGIQESMLGVRPDGLHAAVERVATSGTSARARAYREEMGLPPAPDRSAVVVQPLIPSECAGVAFSAGVTGNEVFIEAVAGLGDVAVGGLASPESVTLRRSGGSWRIHARRPGIQTVATRVRRGEVSREELPRDGVEWQDLLEEALAVRIAEGLGRLESATGQPMDVEWGYASGRLWFLQARPRTRPLAERLPSGETWTRANLRDVLPEIPSAFTRATLIPGLEAAEREHLRSFGIEADAAVPLVISVYGRPIFNERIFRVGDLLGVSREAMQLEFGGSAVVRDAVPQMAWRRALRHPLVLARAMLAAWMAGRRAERLLERLVTARRELAALDASGVSDVDLLDAVEETSGWLVRGVALAALNVAGAASGAQSAVIRRLRRHADPAAMLSRLLADGEASVSTRGMEELVGLAQGFRPWPGATRFLDPLTEDHRSAQYWEERLPPELWARVSRWLDHFGHRGPYESDIASPGYAEDLRLLGRALLPFLLQEAAFNAPEGNGAARGRAAGVWSEVDRIDGRRGRRGLRRAVRKVKGLLALREALRSESRATIVALRSLCLEAGKRLVRRGALESPDMIWHLTPEEIRRTFSGRSSGAAAAVARERARRVAWRRVQVPNRFTSEDGGSFGLAAHEVAAGGKVFRGNGISPGVVEAEVRVVWTPHDPLRFMSGAVLVAPATDPGWTPFFARAAAVVTEIGGALSHAGIVAREYGLPCVTNIPGVTDLLQDGDVVRVDGSAGVVTVVTRAPVAHMPADLDR